MSAKWEVVIGLETHAQLQTQSKIFSGAATAFGAAPNALACAVDIALPGVLPVLNREAVVCAIKFGLSVGAEIAPRSIFARKNYFYPDLPKGYQISQFEIPVVSGGGLTIQVEGQEPKFVRLTRAHLEEDAGKSLHEDFQGKTGIDLNRAGTPLLEIVTEPDMSSAAEAVAYAKALHSLVTWIDICDGNMQEGSFRCDANVSVRRPGEPLGTRREIKNLNSFRFLEQAINYEIQWQISEIEDGRKIQQATVLFDPDTGETRAMRSKEDAQDYRYFPDPDLLPLEIKADWIAEVKSGLPELPSAMQQRFQNDYGLSAYDAATLTTNLATARYFEEVVTESGYTEPRVPPKIAANWIMGEIFRRTKDISESPSISNVDSIKRVERFFLNVPTDAGFETSAIVRQFAIADEIRCPVIPWQLFVLVKRIADGTISNNAAKLVFEALWTHEGTDPDAIIDAKGLKQITDTGAIEAIIDEVLAANQKSVDEFRAGKDKAFNALVGQAMKATKGKANPQQVNDLLKKKLGA